MPNNSKIIGTIEKIAAAQEHRIGRINNRTSTIRELEDYGFLRKEVDPIFRSSPAYRITVEDIETIRNVPFWFNTISKMQGPKGEDGYTPMKGIDYFDGKDGKDGMVGPKGEKGDPGEGADVLEMYDIATEEASDAVKKHTQEFDHAELLKNSHDSKMLGDYELDVETLNEGDLLQVKGKKIVGVKMPRQKSEPYYAVSSGASNVRSITVTEDRELDALAIYVIDASAGDITITVPSASGRENYWYELIRIDSSNNTVTVVPTGSETFSGYESYIMQQWTNVKLFAYQGNYLLRGAS